VWEFLRRRGLEDLAQLLEAAPDAIVVADADDRIVAVNAEAVRTFGHPRERMVGADLAMLVPERFRASHRERSREYFARPRRRALGAEARVFGLRADGTEFPAEITLAPLATARGTLVVGTVRDATEIRRAEEALRESEAKHRSLLHDVLDATAAGVCVFDAAGRTVWMNAAFEEQFGLERRGAVGMEAARLIDALLAPAVEDADALRRALARPAAAPLACRVLPAPGRPERWLELRVRPVRTGHYLGGTIVHSTDATERREAERKLGRYRNIVSNMPIGILVYRLEEPGDDRSLRAIVLNEAGERLLGLARSEVLGRRVDELFPALRATGVPAMLAEVIATGRARDFVAFRYGDARVREGSWTFRAFPLPDSCAGLAFDRGDGSFGSPT
jgi:PAS domain S-box-containing protein